MDMTKKNFYCYFPNTQYRPVIKYLSKEGTTISNNNFIHNKIGRKASIIYKDLKVHNFNLL